MSGNCCFLPIPVHLVQVCYKIIIKLYSIFSFGGPICNFDKKVTTFMDIIFWNFPKF